VFSLSCLVDEISFLYIFSALRCIQYWQRVVKDGVTIATLLYYISSPSPHAQVSELFSMEQCDQAVMDFLATTEVGNFPPK